MESTCEITNTEEVFNLVELIIKEQYSKDISDIARDLLYNGISTIPEIQARSKGSFEGIKNALIVLLQNKLAISKTVVKKNTEMVGYEILVDNVLGILQYPKILGMVNAKFGEYGMMIFEEFMHLGILSAGQVFEQVKARIEKGKKINVTMVNKIKVAFVNLIEGNYVIQAAKVKGRQLNQRENVKGRRNKSKENDGNKKGARNNKSKEKDKGKDKEEYIGISNVGKGNNKKNNKGNNSKDIDMKITELDEEITEELNLASSSSAKKNKKSNKKIMTSSNNINDDKSNIPDTIPNTNPPQKENEESNLLFNKQTGKYYYFFFNYDQIISEIKTQIIIDFITQKISSQAALISSLLLEKNQISSYQSGRTFPLTFREISTRLNSITENQLYEIIRESSDFFLKLTSDTICLNLTAVSNSLKDQTIEKIIEQQYSISHVRIYRLLSLCGALDSRNIMDICLFPPKICNALMNQLFSEGLVETQGITIKSSNILFYSINRSNVIERLISNCYKIIKNMKLSLTNELDHVKNTVSNQVQEQYIAKVSSVINEIDDTIIVLKSLN